MKWIKIILWLVFGLGLLLVLLLHIGSAVMYYDTDDILTVLPKATIEHLDIDNTIVRTIHINNESDTLLVFVHGAPGSFDAFLDYISDSSFQSYDMIVYDRPGYAGSSSSPMTSIKDQSQILLNIINRYSNPQTILIGHSYGGPIVGYTAAIEVNNIDGAVMIAPLLDPEKEPIFWFSYFAYWPMTKWILTDDLITAGSEKFKHAQSLEEIESSWHSVRIPMLHIHGGNDALAPPKVNTNYSRRMIDSTFLDIEYYSNEGHLILWDNFEMTKNSILEFIRQ